MLDAAGCDVVLVETVGVGQSEVEVAGLADTTIVLLAPGMGDGIQAAKAGILEIGDVFVVNKADRDGADATVRDIRHMISLGDRDRAGPAGGRRSSRPSPPGARASTRSWRRSTSTRPGWSETGALRERRVRRAGDEIESIALQQLRARMGDLRHGNGVDELAAAVVDGKTDPYAAADQVVAALA